MRFRNTPKPFGNSLKGADAAGAGAGAAVVGAAAGMLPPGVDGTNNFQFTKMGTSAMVAGPLIGGIATAAGLGADLIMGAAQKRKDRKAIIDNGALLQDQMEADSVYAQEGGYNQDVIQFKRGGNTMRRYAQGGNNIIPNSSMQQAGEQFQRAGVTPTVIGGQGGPTEDNQRMMTPNGPIAVSSGEGAEHDDVLNKVARSMGIGFAEYQRSLYPDAEGGNVRSGGGITGYTKTIEPMPQGQYTKTIEPMLRYTKTVEDRPERTSIDRMSVRTPDSLRQYAQGGPTEPYRAKNKADYDHRVQMYNDSMNIHVGLDKMGGLLKSNPGQWLDLNRSEYESDSQYRKAIYGEQFDQSMNRLIASGSDPENPEWSAGKVEHKSGDGGVNYNLAQNLFVPPRQKVLPPIPAVARTSVDRMDVRTPGMPEPQAGTPNSVPRPQAERPSYSFEGGFRSPDALRFRVGPGNREVADGELSGMRAYARGGPGGPGGPVNPLLREQNPFAPTAIPLSGEVSGVTPNAYDLLNPQAPAPQGSLYREQSPMAPTWQEEVPIDLDATAPLLPDKSASAYMELMRQDPTPLVPASVGNPASPNGKAAQDAAKSVTQSVTDKLNDETKPNTNMNQEELWLNRLNRTSRNINLAGSAGSFVYNLLSKRTPGMAPRKLEHKPLDLDTNALKNMLANQTKSNMKTAQYNFRGRQNLGAELGIIAAGANQKMANAMQVEQVQNTERQYNNAGENRVRQYNNDAFNQFAQNEVAANNKFREMKGVMLTNNLSAMGQSYGNYVDGQIQLSQIGKQARLWDSYEAFRSGESNDVMSDDDYVYDIRGYRKRRRNERKAANA